MATEKINLTSIVGILTRKEADKLEKSIKMLRKRSLVLRPEYKTKIAQIVKSKHLT